MISAARVWPTLVHMSRKPAPIKIIDLEDGMPRVEQARLLLQHELQIARQQGYAAVKLINGYGSSGVGGSLRIELQKELQRMTSAGTVRSFIAGEDWRIPTRRHGPYSNAIPSGSGIQTSARQIRESALCCFERKRSPKCHHPRDSLKGESAKNCLALFRKCLIP